MGTSKRNQQILERQEWEDEQRSDLLPHCYECDTYGVELMMWQGLNYCPGCICDDLRDNWDDLTSDERFEAWEIDNEEVQATYIHLSAKPLVDDQFETLNRILKPI